MKMLNQIKLNNSIFLMIGSILITEQLYFYKNTSSYSLVRFRILCLIWFRSYELCIFLRSLTAAHFLFLEEGGVAFVYFIKQKYETPQGNLWMY